MCELCDLRRECLRHFGTLLDLARVSLSEVSDGLVRMRFKPQYAVLETLRCVARLCSVRDKQGQ